MPATSEGSASCHDALVQRGGQGGECLGIGSMRGGVILIWWNIIAMENMEDTKEETWKEEQSGSSNILRWRKPHLLADILYDRRPLGPSCYGRHRGGYRQQSVRWRRE